MNEKAVLREAMKVKGISQAKLAEDAGYRYQSSVGNIMMRPSMRVDVLVRLLNALDCELVVRSRRAVELLGTNAGTYVPEWVIDEGTLDGEEGNDEESSVPKNPKKAKKAELKEDI